MTRFETKKIRIGNTEIGGGAPVAIQTMLCRRPDDIAGNIKQAQESAAAGCEILRAAVPDKAAIKLIPAIKGAVNIPLVADIHFDYRLALEAIAAGADKIRINPGNIGADDRVKAVANACNAKNIPIRIGVNAGSLERHILERYGKVCPEALVESAKYHASLLEKFDFNNIVISVKSSDVKIMVQACRLLAQISPYPIHLGVTEAGTERTGLIKSAAGIGSLLLDDIGDTIRVTLTEDCAKEVAAAKDLLRALGIRRGVQIISCPTCGRTTIDIISLSKKVEALLKDYPRAVKVAVMGCAVNGPGEAREADIGIVAGGGEALLFKKGVSCGKYRESEILGVLMQEIETV
ncbi:MAG: flavodoxin-dependent (E)-4-hydroxy-3-methylbut-2-enyl-diphosphate synthase [Oscillospiraceae bacterium]|jgi:(E)-4-hydroxy-3-methylbut-2-enyl-diphosphate synthase|nr:flavodoxin-dependent (E)-4-hydroxy-3-methylbut-2-enyl-diphosphate synthase [Oscillospiraceae bacterium]